MSRPPEKKTNLVRMRVPSPPPSRPRRSRRRSIAGVLVEIEVPALGQQVFVADGFDINADGMGLVLPPALPIATHVLLTFRLDDRHQFSRVPAVVWHRDPMAGGGGVRFETWSERDRLLLLEHLASH